MRKFGLTICAGALIHSACAPKEGSAPKPPETPAAANETLQTSEPEIRRISDIDFASYSRDLAKSIDIKVGEPMDMTIPKIEAYFVPQGGDVRGYSAKSSITQTETIYSTFEAEGAKVILVDRINMRDDSVSAQQFYAIGKKKADGSDILIDYGMKIKCWRGENPNMWTKELCP